MSRDQKPGQARFVRNTVPQPAASGPHAVANVAAGGFPDTGAPPADTVRLLPVLVLAILFVAASLAGGVLVAILPWLA
jgi:hypothetical protein